MLITLLLKVLRSARYAYDNTPDSDSRLRAHYLALIIRSRKTFKRSGTMQMEMEMGYVMSGEMRPALPLAPQSLYRKI
jgi:hypothetical protein